MAVFFRSGESEIRVETGVYQEFPKTEDAGSDKTPTSKCRHFSVVLVSFGLLCVLQAVLNIALRLTLTESCMTNSEQGSTDAASASEAPSPHPPTNEPTLLPTDGGAGKEYCPDNWLTSGSSCYYISSERRNWDRSRQDCLERGADLVIINSRKEQEFIMKFIVSAWVGMTDREEEGMWKWVDGTPVMKDRLHWAPGQPDGAYGGEDCGDIRVMIDFVGLNDFNCSAQVPWICEKRLRLKGLN